MSEAAVRAYTRGMYGRVRQQWAEHGNELFGGACGYSVLGSPPRYQPDIIFIGANPGFSEEDARGPAHLHDTWPESPYFGGDRWPYKEKLKRIFTEAGLGSSLEDAVVTNFLFFKSGSISRASRHRWQSLSPALRKSLHTFSERELRGFVKLSDPKLIVVLGMGSFDRHAENVKPEVWDSKKRRRLLASGTVYGHDALGLIHPSGARISDEDSSSVSSWLCNKF